MSDIYADATNGVSTGPGDSANPFATIQQAVDAANGGDTIWLGDSATFTLSSGVNWTAFGGVQDTSVDNRLVVRGWDYSAGASADGRATIDGNTTVPGVLTLKKNYVTFYHLDITNTAGTTHQALKIGNNNLIVECAFTNITGTNCYAVHGSASNYSHVLNCRFDSVVNGTYSAGAGMFSGNLVTNFSGYGVVAGISSNIQDNVFVSGGGIAIYGTVDSVVIRKNTIIGDTTTASKYGVSVGTGGEAWIITDNRISDWTGASNIGILNTTGNAIGVVGGNYYHGNTANESTGIATAADLYLSAAGVNIGAVWTGGGTASVDTTGIAAAVWDEARSDHVAAGTFGEGVASVSTDVTVASSNLAAGVWNAATASYGSAGSYGEHVEAISTGGGGADSTSVAAAVWDHVTTGHETTGTFGGRMMRIPDVAPGTSGGLVLAATSDGYISGISGSVANTLDDIAGPSFTSDHALDQVASTSDMAAGLWNAPTTDYGTTGTYGESIENFTAADSTTIAADVWDMVRSGHATTGTFGEGVASVIGGVGSVSADVTVASSNLAAGVWNAATADYGGVGTYGQDVEDMSIDSTSVAAAVWDMARSAHNTTGTFGEGVASVTTAVTFTSSDVAATVWNAGTVDYGTAGSYGEALEGISVADSTTVAAAVWNSLRSAHTTTGSFGEGVASVQGNVTGSVASVSTDVTYPSSSIAGAVWNGATADYGSAGTYGEKLEGLSVSLDSTTIEAAVWGAATTSWESAGTYGLKVGSLSLSSSDMFAACTTALDSRELNYLVSAAVTSDAVANDSIIAKIVSAGSTATWSGFDNTTRSLQALGKEECWCAFDFIGGTTDKYRNINWFRGAAPISSGVSQPTIEIMDENGARLISPTTLTLATTDAGYKFDAGGALLTTTGVAYTAKFAATINSTVHTFERGFVRS